MAISVALNSGDSAGDLPLSPQGIPGAATDKFARAKLSPSGPPVRGGLTPLALRRVRDYVESHLGNNITIPRLAAIAGLSVYHFARAFKQSEGVPPHDYLLQCRVRRVQQLLAGTDLPVAEIARVTGFFDQSHCTRQFRERVGVTPTHYRRSLR